MDTEKRRINKGIMQGWTIIASVLFLSYFLELLKGNRTAAYFITIAVLDMVPLVAAWGVYKKKQDSNTIRFLCSIFYFIFYLFVLWTGVTPMVFSYILPMLYLLMLSNDKKLIAIISAAMLAANLGSVIMQAAVERKAVADNLTEWEIQIGATLLCSIFAYLASKISASLYEERMKVVQDGEKRLEDILEQVNEVSGIVEDDTIKVLEKLDMVQDVTNKTAGAMDEIASGASQSTNMVETQMRMTADIQTVIDHTNAVSLTIADHVEETTKKVAAGISNMKKLSESADLVEENSSQVMEHMRLLQETTKEVQNIISIISGIADQTNLLALNASIEAARAGETGRGFAVVAGEINALANQTKEATENIEDMVNTLKKKAGEVAEAVQKMAELNNFQNDIIRDTDTAFGEIRTGVSEVKQNTDKEKHQMEKLLSANAQLVESVQTISSVSQEVMANALQTQEITKDNKEAVIQAAAFAKELGGKVKELKSYAAR